MRVCVGGEPRAVKRSRERDPAGKTRIRAACSVRHQRCGLAGSASAKSTMGVWTAGESDFGSEDYGAPATATVVPDGVVDGFREPYRRLAAGVSCSTSDPQSLRARFRSGYTETTEESFREAYKNEGAVTMPFEKWGAPHLAGEATDSCADPSSICEWLSRCSEVACTCGLPICYFDLGCGVYRNARTRPENLQFCNCYNPPIILSHWDADHWAGTNQDRRFLQSRWVAPRQSVGPSHTKFANKILWSGGSLLIVQGPWYPTIGMGVAMTSPS